jgi:hypothetical protein
MFAFCIWDGKKEQVKAISCDMSPAFIKGVRDNLPKAKITFEASKDFRLRFASSSVCFFCCCFLVRICVFFKNT